VLCCWAVLQYLSTVYECLLWNNGTDIGAYTIFEDAITVSMFIKRLGLTCAGSTLSTSLDYLSYDANPYGVKCSEPSISESASIIWFIRVSSLLFT